MDQKPHTPSQYATQACIDACFHCHQICLSTAMNRCIDSGAVPVEAKLFRLLISCAEICQVSANFQLGNSDFQHRICELCAEVCDACAANCEAIEDMEPCVKACLACAISCRQMGVIQA
jgi:hypothetical protein